MHYTTPGFEGMELSTQLVIKEALARGYETEILDKETNFIRIIGKGRSEYIKEATRTRMDSYISPLLMENKLVTKILLKEAGITVPAGESFTSRDDLSAAYLRWKDRSFVLKPNSTNYGKAVFLFPDGSDKEAFENASVKAFSEDSRVLIEELIQGKEYRFLVIGDGVRAVLHRIPANVTGDGNSTIAELVDLKNKNPLRQKGYISPLEKISMGEEERQYLNRSGWGRDSVPPRGEIVFLRENSNISTGGDSIDFTDRSEQGYKDIALAAARKIGAKICGIDLIAGNIEALPDGENYAVIEMNFNPALHIHDFPAVGINRKVESHVLDLLNL